MAQKHIIPAYTIEPWNAEHDSSTFTSGIAQIDKYIKEQARRDVSSKLTMVFVLTEPGSKIIRAYYSLSALGILFSDLPENIQKKLPRYPQISATLLGRLGVDMNYSARVLKKTGQKPRFGELLLINAQINALKGAKNIVGSALFVIDVLSPTAEEMKNGVGDPLSFYKQYGFLSFPGNERRLFKLTRTIEQEFAAASKTHEI